MDWDAAGAIADILAATGVIVSLFYLAIQIRQNTKALRSASYHQAAQQTWSASLAVANDATLAEVFAKSAEGRPLTPVEQYRMNSFDVSVIFGFENMLRLHEEGLLDPEVWDNVIRNTMGYLGNPRTRAFLAGRPGPLSARLLAEIEKHADLYPETAVS